MDLLGSVWGPSTLYPDNCQRPTDRRVVGIAEHKVHFQSFVLSLPSLFERHNRDGVYDMVYVTDGPNEDQQATCVNFTSYI